LKKILKLILQSLIVSGIFCVVIPGSNAQTPSNFTFGGFIDTYYAYDFNTPASRDRGYTTQPTRHNEFNLNLGFLDAKYASEEVRGRFALGTGTYMISNYAAEPDFLKNIYEANAGFNISGSWWLDAGIFASHIGFESAISKDNWNYSRSLMADYSPYYESGVKVTGNISDELFAGFFVLNGWQNIRENNDDKALGTQLQYKPCDDIVLNWSGFYGNEIEDTDSTSPSQIRIFNDFYAQIDITENFCVAAVLDIGFQEKAVEDGNSSWYAAALLARYTISPQWKIAARGEMYNDKDGVLVPTGTINNFQVTGASLNLDYAPADNVVARIEGRILVSEDEIFQKNRGGLFKTNSFIVTSLAVSL
jgi:hypothetical protein